MNFMNALATFYSQKKGLHRGTHLRILNVMYDFPTRASTVSFPSLWSEHKAYCPLDLPYLPWCQELHALSHLEAVADEMLQGQEVLVQVFRSCERQEDTAECSHQLVALWSQDSRVSFRRQKQKTWPIVKPRIISLHHTSGEKNAFSILVKLSHWIQKGEERWNRFWQQEEKKDLLKSAIPSCCCFPMNSEEETIAPMKKL